MVGGLEGVFRDLEKGTAAGLSEYRLEVCTLLNTTVLTFLLVPFCSRLSHVLNSVGIGLAFKSCTQLARS